MNFVNEWKKNHVTTYSRQRLECIDISQVSDVVEVHQQSSKSCRKSTRDRRQSITVEPELIEMIKPRKSAVFDGIDDIIIED